MENTKNKIKYGLLGLIAGFAVGGHTCSQARYVTHASTADVYEELDKDPPNGDLDGDGCYPDYVIWTHGSPLGCRPLKKTFVLYNDCNGFYLMGRSRDLSEAENDAIEHELNKGHYFFFE